MISNSKAREIISTRLASAMYAKTVYETEGGNLAIFVDELTTDDFCPVSWWKDKKLLGLALAKLNNYDGVAETELCHDPDDPEEIYISVTLYTDYYFGDHTDDENE